MKSAVDNGICKIVGIDNEYNDDDDDDEVKEIKTILNNRSRQDVRNYVV